MNAAPVITVEDVEEAYIRLKKHVYYDKSDIFIRKRLAEFETNLSSDINILNVNQEYKVNKNDLGEITFTKSIKEKFKRITYSLNNEDEFFDSFLNKLEVHYLPKKISRNNIKPNVITNRRIQDSYKIERASAFIDIPIELHIVTVLWIMKHGKEFDAALSNSAYGNRLLLNEFNNDLVQGSTLFKPYPKQYQNWRDNSVKIAKSTLSGGEDITFINLDIKDYYYSVKLNIDDEIFNSNYLTLKKLFDIFKKIHLKFTNELKQYNFPFNYNGKLEKDEVNLPIGLLSSYIIGNYYLKDFDDEIHKKVKPLYYGRYVDDLLFVIKNPDKDLIYNNGTSHEIVEFELGDVLRSRKFKEEKVSVNNTFLIEFIDEKYSNLVFQSEKTLIHYFSHQESDLVIDKLKQDLEERSSEFRDMPSDEDDTTFEAEAFHLLYDNSEGKIKTLKDYKENSFGLSVFLSKKIFTAIRNNEKHDYIYTSKVLKLFQGINNLELNRIWEKVFVFFMVNKDAESFVDFYVHTFDQIDKITTGFIDKEVKVEDKLIKGSLLKYLDGVFELSLSLNPMFLKGNSIARKKIEFYQSKNSDIYEYFTDNYSELTNSTSYYITRFRESNLIRHHYLPQPLISYTNAVSDKRINLTKPNIKFEYNKKPLKFEDLAIENSPRTVKFWECCLAVINDELSQINKNFNELEGDINTDLFNFNENGKVDNVSYLDKAFDLYKNINCKHIANHKIDYDDIKSALFNNKVKSVGGDSVLNEIHVENENKLDKIRISFASTKVDIANIEASIDGKPNLGRGRYSTLQKIFKQTRLEKADMLLLPENSLPYSLLSSMARYSSDNSIMSVAGLEHWTVGKYSFNFIVDVLPVNVNNTKDAVVVIRLKNHYAPGEIELINSRHLYIPKPSKYRYDLINWRNVYFSTFYCFELADSIHRSIFKSKVDLLIASEWNRDIPYYSNIVEALTRDIHAYIAQVNTSQYGDSRLTKPSSSAIKDILKLKGGENDTVLIGEIDIKSLRSFQSKKNIKSNDFKPLPPNYDYNNVFKRTNNQFIVKDNQ